GEGDVLAIGDVVGSIDTSGKASTSSTGSSPAEPKPEPKAETPAPVEPKYAVPVTSGGDPINVTVPTVGESITEVTVAQWLMDDGAAVSEGDLICEIESDKASFELPAETNGILKQMAAEGDVVIIGDVIASITPGSGGTASAPAPSPTSVQPAPTPATNGSTAPGGVRVSPVAANILAEAGINPGSIQGTGPGGKILKEDAIRARDNKATAPASPSPTLSVPSPAPVAATAAAGPERSEKRERMSSLRKTIAKRLVEVKNQTAMLTTFNEVDMSGIMETRSKYKDIFKEKHGIKLGFMSLFTRAVCIAASEWPSVNGKIEDNHIVHHNYCDISIAVSSPRGLVVPVVRNADKL
ncbi:MAG: 2-oxo acid dehydrogenase subunit E2, partial [Calditrichota bacterium]